MPRQQSQPITIWFASILSLELSLPLLQCSLRRGYSRQSPVTCDNRRIRRGRRERFSVFNFTKYPTMVALPC
ncbi:uncharacterized protein BDZ83DRAFT_614314 [Colletotrichum acutatum]|uniref:Secreted protein n=1 Tax=Glomerella acutata TaxID=27357 RepID=A0AAD8UT91_GLOAC|nr:uncharacterized protein BDZ83DRAFT_614314 [Colletotrichum acutatum]KAK1726911.1 hypothetical protein BDZ83DRAFT_614314 [Colletotrichum acutatum]